MDVEEYWDQNLDLLSHWIHQHKIGFCAADVISTKISRPLVEERIPKKYFSHMISQPKHVLGPQKNRLNESVLLSTQNIC